MPNTEVAYMIILNCNNNNNKQLFMSSTEDEKKVYSSDSNEVAAHQKWTFCRVPSKNKKHHKNKCNTFKIESIVNETTPYLSAVEDGSRVTLQKKNNSNRQQWIFENIGRKEDSYVYNIIISGGVKSDRKYLTVSKNGKKYYLGNKRYHSTWILQKDLVLFAREISRVGLSAIYNRQYLSVDTSTNKLLVETFDDPLTIPKRASWSKIPSDDNDELFNFKNDETQLYLKLNVQIPEIDCSGESQDISDASLQFELIPTSINSCHEIKDNTTFVTTSSEDASKITIDDSII